MVHCITLKHYQPTAGALSSTGLRPLVFSAFFDKSILLRRTNKRFAGFSTFPRLSRRFGSQFSGLAMVIFVEEKTILVQDEIQPFSTPLSRRPGP
jgi:hypothetical protein